MKKKGMHIKKKSNQNKIAKTFILLLTFFKSIINKYQLNLLILSAFENNKKKLFNVYFIAKKNQIDICIQHFYTTKKVFTSKSSLSLNFQIIFRY